MNLFQIHDDTMHGKCWVTKEQKAEVIAAISKCDDDLHTNARTQFIDEEFPKGEMPPTHYPQNKFTAVFLNIVNSYGVPSYKEINPAFFYLY